jgi:uncharacterized Zn finger protein
MLVNLLNEKVLMGFAGERTFKCGEDYFAEGYVVGPKEQDDAIAARVRGTYYYLVKLWAEGEGLAFECNCPVGQDRVFCKHCVAVGLAWLDRRKQVGDVSKQQTKRDVTDEEIRAQYKPRRNLMKLLDAEG